MGSIKMVCFTAFKSLHLKTTSKITWSCTAVTIQCFVRNKRYITEAINTASFIVIQPALALVDDRLAGEGTGKALGISDPILGWIIIGVFSTVWALYYSANKELGGQQEEDGLGL